MYHLMLLMLVLPVVNGKLCECFSRLGHGTQCHRHLPLLNFFLLILATTLDTALALDLAVATPKPAQHRSKTTTEEAAKPRAEFGRAHSDCLLDKCCYALLRF